ncbi:replication endonuclease [Salmonella enterica]|nr:replication endonuclease [Salmonella enterica]EAU1443660.1 replication endonuclease [Salmonella enterica]
MMNVIDAPESYQAVNALRREQFGGRMPDHLSACERDLYLLNSDDHDWHHNLLKDVPDYLARYFVERYIKTYNSGDPHTARRRANTFLRQTLGENILPRLRMVSDRYRSCGPAVGAASFPFYDQLARLPMLGRDELRQLANAVADYHAQAFTLFSDRYVTAVSGDDEMRQRVMESYRHLGEIAQQIGTVPPYWGQFVAGRRPLPTHSAESGMLRMMAPEWWLGRLKRARDIQREHMAIAVGQVQKAASSYVSRGTLHEWLEQKRRNREFFKAFDLENDEGQRVPLADMIIASNANPANRRRELMVRMRGFEDLAQEMGMVGEFYTMTAPSKYHAVHSGGGFVDQWNGASPRDTQKYLCRVWSQARAAIKRAGISYFGFRVVEPHHDGTPHWHMLFFMPPQYVDTMRDILCYYARLEDSEELQSQQALKARFHVEPIDPTKGSATGYIAKYISKNIDGYALADELDDETGQSLKDMAKAVSAWAGRWRIRQFQQLGGAPVTVWREMRKLRGQQLSDAAMDAVLASADLASDWAAYTMAQGGPLVSRADLVVRLKYDITPQGNQYAEDVQRIAGIYSPRLGAESTVCTRLAQWKIVPKLAAASAEAGFSGAIGAPWSSVNNCTPEEWRRLSIELKSRGMEATEQEVDILARGGRLKFGRESALVWKHGGVIEVREEPKNWSWPGWN